MRTIFSASTRATRLPAYKLLANIAPATITSNRFMLTCVPRTTAPIATSLGVSFKPRAKPTAPLESQCGAFVFSLRWPPTARYDKPTEKSSTAAGPTLHSESRLPLPLVQAGRDRIKCQVYGGISTSLLWSNNPHKLLILKGLSRAWPGKWALLRNRMHSLDL